MVKCKKAIYLIGLNVNSQMIFEKMKNRIYYFLTSFRDHSWVPNMITDFIDWLRYEFFYPNDFVEESATSFELHDPDKMKVNHKTEQLRYDKMFDKAFSLLKSAINDQTKTTKEKKNQETGSNKS